jgi:hypothetical protein
VDEVVTADEDQIANAILPLLEMENRGRRAGYIPLAASSSRPAGKKVISIISETSTSIFSVGCHRGLTAAGRGSIYVAIATSRFLLAV